MKPDHIIVHCSATKAGADFKASDIDAWHRARGFRSIGYHYVIDLDGTIEKGRAESETGAHCTQQRMNHHSIGICYIGGLDLQGSPCDTRTSAQKTSMAKLIAELRQRYPGIKVRGHRDLAPKACPCFDAHSDYGGE